MLKYIRIGLLAALTLTLTHEVFARKCTITGLSSVHRSKFFVGPDDCKLTSCLIEIKPNSRTKIPSGEDFKLVYVPVHKTKKYESAAIIQINRSEEKSRNTKKIDISRSRIDFRCNIRGHRDRIRRDNVDFYLYERWHSTGRPRRTELASWLINKFHFKYEVEGACIATGSPGVRERFKFENRDELASGIDRLLSMLSPPKPRFTGTAIATEANASARKIHVEGFTTELDSSNTHTCISHPFRSPEKGTVIILSLDDLANHAADRPSLFSTTLKHFRIVGE